jgi:hypothetical protein
MAGPSQQFKESTNEYMNLPKVVAELINAQNSYDSGAYANCFFEKAVVFDEGKIMNGRTEIESWIAKANEKYKTMMDPVSYEGKGTSGILAARVSGTFEGSPTVLNYHFEFIEGWIRSLKVTG